MRPGSIRTEPRNLFCGICGAPRFVIQAAAMVAGPVSDDSPTQELEALWQATQNRLRSSVPESTFRLWLEPLEVSGADSETLYLKAPEGIRAWAERRYASLIAEALADSDTPLRRVSFAAPTGSATDPGRLGPGRAQSQLHLRPLRHRPQQPARPRRRAGGGRGTLGGLQPALPPRASRARQDPPAGGDRQLPRRQRPRAQRPLHDRRVLHQRVRRRPALGRRRGLQDPLPRHRRAADRRRPVPRGQARHRGGVLPHLQRPL